MKKQGSGEQKMVGQEPYTRRLNVPIIRHYKNYTILLLRTTIFPFHRSERSKSEECANHGYT